MTSITCYADDKQKKLALVLELAGSEPDSKEYWQAYCDFIDAEAELLAAIARADRANGTWELKVVE
jgi:hypothetical protein